MGVKEMSRAELHGILKAGVFQVFLGSELVAQALASKTKFIENHVSRANAGNAGKCQCNGRDI
jgi:hypothetical protein